ncbi:hypothetical protein P692DRAFT_20760870, partial [Suillus brevipes Sb2]
MGFIDGPKAIKYYDRNTHRIKISRNYHFFAPTVQREGERDRVSDTLHIKAASAPKDVDNIASQKEISGKRKRENDIPDEPRRSTRQKVKHDYRILNDPTIELEEIPAELVALAEEDSDEEELIYSPAEIVYAAFNETGIAPEDPKSLKEAKESSEWPEWERAIHAELTQ